MICELQDKIFAAEGFDFEAVALGIYRYQYNGNEVYRAFSDALNRDPANVLQTAGIPFMPVSFFKHHKVATGRFEAEAVFESSGTTQTGNSRHIVRLLDLYRKSFMETFRRFYGEPRDLCILGLLPSYLERKNSSLVFMAAELIRQSAHPRSGFYLYDHQGLADAIRANESAKQPTLLIGVTFALLDFAGVFRHPLQHTLVMETGGMKGRRKEITRQEVHDILKDAWELSSVHSEYGMSELLSQAYSRGDGIFSTPPWMRILVRDEDDPLTIKPAQPGKGVQGLINVIDLANIHSCSFIATDDVGRLHADNRFEVTGRMDSSDVRGCSLMYAG